MNSQMPASTMAIPPKKYQAPVREASEAVLAPWNPHKANIVLVKGTKKPRSPSSVGLPNRFARSPFAWLGWKNNFSYCSGVRATVI